MKNSNQYFLDSIPSISGIYVETAFQDPITINYSNLGLKLLKHLKLGFTLKKLKLGKNHLHLKAQLTN